MTSLTNYGSNQYRIAHCLNRIAQCLNRMVDATLIVTESNRDLILPITDAADAVTTLTVGADERRDTTCKYASHRSSHSTLGIHRRSTTNKHVITLMRRRLLSTVYSMYSKVK